MVEGVCIRVETRIKYLGLYIDGAWSFREHFALLAPRVNGVAASLRRLLPNIGGPGGGVCRLYAATVHAVALYGALVWVDRAMATRRTQQLMRQVQKRVAIGVSGIPPFELLAQMYAEVYRHTRALRDGGSIITDRIRITLRHQARQALVAKWQQCFRRNELAGQRVVGAIGPILADWLEGQRGRVTFHATQVLSGHSCFGDYLCRIGRECTARCHHCGGNWDSAQHTLEPCPAWIDQRRVLVQIVGEDLSLPAIVAATVGREEAWRAFASFYGTVMSQKEAEERIRRGEQPPPDTETSPNRGQGVAALPRRRLPGGRARVHPPIPTPPCGVR